jgi:hypothetical protein
VSKLRKGGIENPGFDQLRAIAETLGFPPEMEFEESLGKAYRYAIQVGQRSSSSGSGASTPTWLVSRSP